MDSPPQGSNPAADQEGLGSWLGEAHLLSLSVGRGAVIWFDTHLGLLGAFWGWRLGALSLHSPFALLHPTGAIFFFSFSFFSFLAYKTLGIFHIFFFFAGRRHLYILPLSIISERASLSLCWAPEHHDIPEGSSYMLLEPQACFFFFLIHTFYWSIVDLQCFRGTSQWFSYTNTHYFWNYFPSEVIIRYWL